MGNCLCFKSDYMEHGDDDVFEEYSVYKNDDLMNNNFVISTYYTQSI